MFKKVAIHSFLLVFLLTSCASSGGTSKKSTAAQRAVETREYNVTSKNLMQSPIGAFQDLGFTIISATLPFNSIFISDLRSLILLTNSFKD